MITLGLYLKPENLICNFNCMLYLYVTVFLFPIYVIRQSFTIKNDLGKSDDPWINDDNTFSHVK